MKSLSKIFTSLIFAVSLPLFADTGTPIVPLNVVPIGKNNFKVGITVSVAGGPPSQLTFDTGGSGLHIFASQVGKQNIRYTGQKVDSSFGGSVSGFTFHGEIAYAPVSIGGMTTKPIPILVIQSVQCHGNGQCPFNTTSGGPPMMGNFYGELGAGMELENFQGSAIKLNTPFRELPGNYGSGFIIQNLSPYGGSGQLVLGLTPDNTTGYKTVQLSKTGELQDNSGRYVYNDKGVVVQYTIGQVSQAWRTAFDTGGNANINLFLGQIPGVPVLGRRVGPGLPFEAVLNNAFDWRFFTGRQEGVNAVSMLPLIGRKGPYVNTGLLFFFNYNVMYNFKDGLLGFMQH